MTRIGAIALAASAAGCLGTPTGTVFHDEDPERVQRVERVEQVDEDGPDLADLGVLRGERVAGDGEGFPQPYPEGPYGWRVGDIVADFSFPGGAADEGIESEIGLGDFWRMAHRLERPRTILIINLHGMTCGMSMAQAGPELEVWQEQYSDRGLVPWGVSIDDDYEGARDYWEVSRGVRHPWAAAYYWSTVSQFFTGPMYGTPSYIVIDLCTMEILHIQEGFSGSEEELFEPYLDRTCGEDV